MWRNNFTQFMRAKTAPSDGLTVTVGGNKGVYNASTALKELKEMLKETNVRAIAKQAERYVKPKHRLQLLAKKSAERKRIESKTERVRMAHEMMASHYRIF